MSGSLNHRFVRKLDEDGLFLEIDILNPKVHDLADPQSGFFAECHRKPYTVVAALVQKTPNLCHLFF